MRFPHWRLVARASGIEVAGTAIECTDTSSPVKQLSRLAAESSGIETITAERARPIWHLCSAGSWCRSEDAVLRLNG